MRHWAEGLVARYARLTFAQLESGCWLGTESFEAFRENGLQPFGYICRSLRQNLPLSGGNLRCWQGPKSKKVAWRLCDMSHMLKLPIDLHQQHSLPTTLLSGMDASFTLKVRPVWTHTCPNFFALFFVCRYARAWQSIW